MSVYSNSHPFNYSADTQWIQQLSELECVYLLLISSEKSVHPTCLRPLYTDCACVSNVAFWIEAIGKVQQKQRKPSDTLIGYIYLASWFHTNRIRAPWKRSIRIIRWRWRQLNLLIATRTATILAVFVLNYLLCSTCGSFVIVPHYHLFGGSNNK